MCLRQEGASDHEAAIVFTSGALSKYCLLVKPSFINHIEAVSPGMLIALPKSGFRAWRLFSFPHALGNWTCQSADRARFFWWL